MTDRSASAPAPSSRPSSSLPWARILAITGILAGGVVLAVLQPWRSPPPPERAAELGARLELAAGDVELVAGETRTRLLSNTPLPVGARLETGDGARALVRLGNGTRLFLRDQTKVEIGDAVTVLEGEVWLEAPALDEGEKAAVHRVGDATVSLSEGGASLRADSAGATIYVAEGLAIVASAAGRSEVQAGERAEVLTGAAPVVGPVTFWDDWTGGMTDRATLAASASSGAGTLYAVDRSQAAGSPALPLAIARQNVRVVIEDQIAETVVDQRFFNPSSTPVEGWYWFTVPEGAQLVSFALETDGQLVEGEIVEKKKAVKTYERAVVTGNDPALLEWIDARTVRARIFPVPAAGERRIVVRYQALLSESDGRLRYVYPLAGAQGKEAATIEEFSLDVELRGKLRESWNVSTSAEARIEERGEHVTMRRSGYRPRADFQLELARKDTSAEKHPLRMNVAEPGGDQADFVMVRWLPDFDFAGATPPKGDVVVVVDTSADGDPSEVQTRYAVAEALLRSLSAGDRFALVAADLESRVLFPKDGLAEATPEAIADALEALTKHGTGGATDLGAVFSSALDRVHGLEQPAVVYVGDGIATSGDVRREAVIERLRRAMAGSRARLFTVGVGAEVDDALLASMARVGGGESLRVESPEQAVVRALELAGALKVPTITDLEIELGEGLDDVFMNVDGKISRGQELVVLARTHHDLPDQVKIKGRFAGEDFERSYAMFRAPGAIDQLVPRLWASAYVERLLGDSRGLEAVRGKVLALGLEYGMMTPFTSFLALDSESAYARQGIERRRRTFPGPRLVTDASQLGHESDEPRTVLGMIAAAASAPFGCSMEAPSAQDAKSAPMQEDSRSNSMVKAEAAMEEAPNDEAGGSGQRHRGEEGKLAEAEPPPPPAAPAAAAMPATDAAEEVTGDFDDGARSAGILGVKGGGSTATGTAAPSGGGGAMGGLQGDDGYADKKAKSTSSPARRDRPMELEKDEEPTDALAGEAWQLEDAEANENAPKIAQNALLGGKPSEVEAKRRALRGQVAVSPVAMMQAMPCSDAAARRLAQRRVLWERRLETQASMFEWLTSYEAAVASCELPGWKDQRVFLDLLQTRVSTEGDVSMLLAHFRTQPDARSYLVKVLLRRLVDPSLVAAVENAVFGADVDWLAVDRALALETDPERRLAIVGKALERSPDDPQGERRLIALYVEQNRIDDAIDRGRRLGEKGLVTPELALQIGELLARAGREDDARRLFSELVEFDPRDANSRRLLGDALFRHGWYAEAYDQYAVLAELLPEDAATQIRLARAAAGAGRVDEALRVFRTIASGEGRPGANDPRRWARLLAGFHLAQLLSAPTKDAPKESVERELKKLRLFEAPGSVTLLVWKDLGADLSFARKPPPNTGATGDEGVKQDPKDAGLDLLAIAGLGDLTDAAGVGLAAIQASASAALPDLVVRHRGWVLDRDVEFDVVTLKWDGTSFDVSTRKGTIVAWATGEGEEPRGRAKAPTPAGEGDPKDPKDPKGTDNPTGGE